MIWFLPLQTIGLRPYIKVRVTWIHKERIEKPPARGVDHNTENILRRENFFIPLADVVSSWTAIVFSFPYPAGG